MAPLKIVIFVLSAIAMVGGLVSWVLSSKEEEAHWAPIAPRIILEKLNERRPATTPALIADAELTEWAENVLPMDGPSFEKISAGDILERMQEDVKGIAAASAGVFRTPSKSPLWAGEIEGWEEPTESAYTHLAVVTRRDALRDHTVIWALLVKRLPEFLPELLAKGLQHFYHTCTRCSKGYNGQFYGGNRILLLQCPHCDKNYDILAVNTRSQYKRANDYFSKLTTPVAFRANMSKREQMEAIWKSVLDHCQYRNDYDVDGVGPAKDSWQTSAETLQRRSGDCEDTSILLADWLISQGIDARVVIGETQALQGHAWCVARVNEKVYLLETTIDRKEVSDDPPLAKTMADRYKPEFLFDRDHLYFFTGQPNESPGDSWDASLWESVDYRSDPPRTSTLDQPVAMAPWFSDTTGAKGLLNGGIVASSTSAETDAP